MRQRDATPEDHALFARFFAQLEVPDPVPSIEQWSAMCKDAFFLEDDGVTVGYAYAQRHGEDAHVSNVVVDAPARGKGVGSVLMRALAERLQAKGCVRWALNVKPDNVPAIKLYERFGLRVAYASTALRIAWRCVDELPRALASKARWRLLDPSEDDATERAFAAFDPTFPGAGLFRVARAELTRALFEAMRAHEHEHDFVRVTIEDDAPLASALIDAGAERVLDILHMRGALGVS